jgi:hypothetical protein
MQDTPIFQKDSQRALPPCNDYRYYSQPAISGLAALATTHRISGAVFPVTKRTVLNIVADMHNLTADEDLMRLQESNVCIRGTDFAGDGRRVNMSGVVQP